MMGMAARLNKVGRLAFSSIANPQLTDWEYTTKIQQSLHQNDINEALKYLINSHLDGQVLDMHIFRNYYLKADKLKAGITYSEIAYQLYRHHFKPHSLVLDWMNSLAKSNNHNIINLLQQDFKSLQIEMPQVKKVEQQDSPKPQQTERAQQSKPSESVLASPPTTSNQTKKDSNVVQVSPLPSISGLEKTTGKEILSREEIERMPAISQIRSGLKSILSSLTGLKPSITFHKIQVFMEDSELYFENEGGFSHETTHEGDQQDSDDEYLEDFSYTRKIKVERIEISFNSLQSNQNFGNQNKQN